MLFEFYNFKDRKIIEVGAGGDGRLLKQYVNLVKRAIATEIDPTEIEKLKKLIADNNWKDKVRLFTEPSLKSLDEHADAAILSFSFHEVEDKIGMISEDKSVADKIIIIDFDLNSEWTYLTKEEEKVREEWAILEKIGFSRSVNGIYKNWFRNYAALRDYIFSHTKDDSRLESYKDKTDFIIDSPFRIVELAKRLD